MSNFCTDQALLERVREIIEGVARGYHAATNQDFFSANWKRLTKAFVLSLAGVAGVKYLERSSFMNTSHFRIEVIFADDSSATFLVNAWNGTTSIDPNGYYGHGLMSNGKKAA